MKYYMLFVLLLPVICLAQQMHFNHDTLIYHYQKFYPGKEIQLGYGSGKPDFSFVYWGADEPSSPVGSNYAHAIVSIEKIYAIWGRYYLKCSLAGKETRLHIDVQRAVDNNELQN